MARVSNPNMTKDLAERAVTNAAYYLGRAFVKDSAKVAYTDAKSNLDKGDYSAAYVRAMDSMGHTIGILHPVYARLNAEEKTLKA